MTSFITSNFNSMLNIISRLYTNFKDIITWCEEIFQDYLTKKNFYGFLLLNLLVITWLSSDSIVNTLLIIFVFLLYYGLFFLATLLNIYIIVNILSYSVSNLAISELTQFHAHPFTVMLILPLIYIVLLVVTQKNKYTADIYVNLNYSSIKLFKFFLINFMITYLIAFVYLVWYKFLHTLPSIDYALLNQMDKYELERQSYKDKVIYYEGFKNWLNFMPIPLYFYFDNLGIFFMGLGLILMYLSFLFLWPTFHIDKNKTLYITQLLLLLTQLQATFTAGSLLGFFIFFESLLIPMLVMIVIWGSKNNRQAANYLVFYTMFSAVPMFLAIMYIMHKTNLQTIPELYYYVTCATDLKVSWTWNEQVFLWLAFFLGFAVKTPMVPFHIWLPKAHVDAPTVGSVILAGLLLKVGLVGFIRILYLLFPIATKFFAPYVAAVATVGVIYSSLITLRQIDMKRIIAYSSVAHMNMAMVSLCSLNSIGVYSSIYLMLSHGLIASGLFFLVGFLYNRFHVRSVYYYGGLATMMPVMSFFFFLFTLANMAFPLTSGFIGEFLLLLGISINNFYMAFLNSFSMLLTTVYSVLLFGRVFLGELKPWFQNMIQQVIEFELLKNINKNTNKGTNYVSIGHIKIFYPTSMPSLFKSISHYDIYYYELIIVLTLFIGIVFLGVYPQIIFTYLQQSMVLTEIINTMLLPYPQDFYVLKNALPTNFYIEYLNIKTFYSDIILKIFFF